jgi:hypothetical protein
MAPPEPVAAPTQTAVTPPPGAADFAGTRFISSGAGAAALETNATPGCSPSQASEAPASQRGPLQPRRGAH